MHVKLKVLRGASAGKEVAITGPRFFIGRSEECHLRANSDAISRRHCAITVDEGDVKIRDLGSRNGTYVNGIRIDGEHRIQMGDQLRVGPLEFLVTYLKSSQIAAKSKSGDSSVVSDDEMAGLIDDWLTEADDAARRPTRATGETREFHLDETNRIDVSAKNAKVEKAKQAPAEKSVPGVQQDPSADPAAPASASPPAKGNERAPVLPTGRRGATKTPPKDTQEAAAQALRKFFNRGS
jgi:pSer/pThr/pTyr-binding forkhead associated (FHA) protein